MRKINRKASKNSRNVGKKAKARMALNIFIMNTNIPSTQVRTLYTLRWQIELMFKIWKSIGKINKVKKMKTLRFEAFLFAKLIWIIINWWIVWFIMKQHYKDEIFISPFKLYKTLKTKIMDFREAVYTQAEAINMFILELLEISKFKHKSDKKKDGHNWSYKIIYSLSKKSDTIS